MIKSQGKKHPVIYEINTRVWMKRFSKNSSPVSLQDIPESFWEELAEKGIDFVWLMGVWQTNKKTCTTHCFTRDLMDEYSRGLPGWKKTDVIGSPYAIDSYRIHNLLGTNNDMLVVKKKINKAGMKLILDFVPNHFSVFSKLLKRIPDIFIVGDEEVRHQAPRSFFSYADDGYIFAHGRDPYFDPWQDTVQVNIFCEKARLFLTETLLSIGSLCDGVRCDMAMLVLNDIFFTTWQHILVKRGYSIPDHEFWADAIQQVRKQYKNFIFIAEAYWDTGWRLQQLGFDYTYDKVFYDRLLSGSAGYIQSHLLAEQGYQEKLVRFIENHDEDRSITSFGVDKSRAAALAISTVQGLCFFYDGQFEGVTRRLPVQLGREKQEVVKKDLFNYYTILLGIRKSRVIQSGTWKLLWPTRAWDGNDTYDHFMAWIWVNRNTHLLVVINYSNIKSQCRLLLDITQTQPFIIFNDLLGNVSYKFETMELVDNGLYIEREGYKSHVFYFKTG